MYTEQPRREKFVVTAKIEAHVKLEPVV